MPEINVATPPVLDPTKNNAEVVRKMNSQDITAQTMAPTDVGPASDALDKLAEAFSPEAKAKADAEAQAKADAEAKAAADKAAEEAAKSPSEPKTVEPAKPSETASKKVEELFKDLPSLPPGASPKSSEAFAAIKIKAAQDISNLESELEKARTELKSLKDNSGQLTPEQEQAKKELEDLRAWRTKLDVDFDPKFKQFDVAIEKARDFIYSQLKKSPAVDESTIKQIKEFGGPDKCNLSKLLEATKDPVLQRVVESQISEILKIEHEKERAVDGAKTNLTQYLSEREKEFKDGATAHTQATLSSLDKMLGSLDWYKERTPGDKATDAEKKQVEEHNKFVGDLKSQINAAISDDTPQMRAILITGLAQLFNLQRVSAGDKQRLDAVEKELAEVKEKWEKVKKSSTTRLETSQASATATTTAKPADTINQRPADALDAIAQQVMAEKARVAAHA